MQVMLGAGVVAASLYAVKALIFPHAQQWYASWRESVRAQKEAQQQQAELLQKAADALKACEVRLYHACGNSQ